jgi:hypothetical protein
MRKKIYILWQLCRNLMLALRQGYFNSLHVLVLYKDAGGITGTVRAKSSLFYARKNVND